MYMYMYRHMYVHNKYFMQNRLQIMYVTLYYCTCTCTYVCTYYLLVCKYISAALLQPPPSARHVLDHITSYVSITICSYYSVLYCFCEKVHMPQMGQRHIQTKASDLARPRSVNAWWNWGLRHEVARGVRVRVRVRVGWGWGWGKVGFLL